MHGHVEGEEKGSWPASDHACLSHRPCPTLCTILNTCTVRKQLGVSKHKRISGEALRTLESVYDRTPYPSADVVK